MLYHLAMCIVYVCVTVCTLILPVLFWIKGTIWLGRKLDNDGSLQDTTCYFLLGVATELLGAAVLLLLVPLCKLGQWIVSNL